MSTQTKTFDTAAGPIEAGKRYLIVFDARDSSDDESNTIDEDWIDADSEEIDGQWTGDVNYVGKLTIIDTFGGPTRYLFPREIIGLDDDPDGNPEYRPQLSADAFLKLPPKDWDRVTRAMKGQEQRKLEDELSMLARKVACAAAYTSARAIGRDHK